MSLDSLKQAFQSFIRRMTYRMDYLALYPATVLKDHGDMSVDIQPHRPRLQDEFPVMTKVPVGMGMPGASVRVKVGTTVLLYFEAGDPTKPRVSITHMLALEHLQIRTGLGHVIDVDDDRGQVSGDNLYSAPKILIRDMAGNQIFWDARPGLERIELRDKANNTVLLSAVPGSEMIELQDAVGQLVVLDAAANLIRLAPNTKVIVGNGGTQVATVGTPVAVDGATHKGTVTGPGSTRLEVDG